MVTPTSLRDQVQQKLHELKEVTAGLDEEKASKAPATGEWCAKEVLSHLAGEETKGFKAGMQLFVKEDTPEYEIYPGITHFEGRKELSVRQLVAKVEAEYTGIGDWLAGLTEEQLQRKAHMPALKETPLTEYPTLGLWAGAMINYHLNDHINQLRALAQ